MSSNRGTDQAGSDARQLDKSIPVTGCLYCGGVRHLNHSHGSCQHPHGSDKRASRMVEAPHSSTKQTTSQREEFISHPHITASLAFAMMTHTKGPISSLHCMVTCEVIQSTDLSAAVFACLLHSLWTTLLKLRN